MYKKCSKCGIEKLFAEYWKHPYGQHGLQARCKSCLTVDHRLQSKARNFRDPKSNSRRWRKSQLNKRYGISLEEYDLMLASQNFVCALCGLPPDSNQFLAVDHDHETGKVRGLLHSACNIAIGMLNDSPSKCRMAAVYLERHGKV